MTQNPETMAPPPGSPRTFEEWQKLPPDVRKEWAHAWPEEFRRLCEIEKSTRKQYF